MDGHHQCSYNAQAQHINHIVDFRCIVCYCYCMSPFSTYWNHSILIYIFAFILYSLDLSAVCVRSSKKKPLYTIYVYLSVYRYINTNVFSYTNIQLSKKRDIVQKLTRIYITSQTLTANSVRVAQDQAHISLLFFQVGFCTFLFDLMAFNHLSPLLYMKCM